MSTELEAQTVGWHALLGELRSEAAAHQTVYEDDRRRKQLLSNAADEIEKLCKIAELGRDLCRVVDGDYVENVWGDRPERHALEAALEQAGFLPPNVEIQPTARASSGGSAGMPG